MKQEPIGWLQLLENVLESKSPFHITVFEDLLRDPISEMRKVMKFLEEKQGFEQDDSEERLLCLSENLQGSSKRKKKDNGINPYNEELTNIMNSQINNAQEILDRAGINISLSSYKRSVT